MLTAGEVGLVTSAMTAVNAPPALIEEIVELLNTHSQDLGGQTVQRVGPGWFGGAATAHRIGVNTSMAHQAVEEEFKKLADALSEYGSAINQWAAELNDTDAMTTVGMSAHQSAIEQVRTTVDEARDESTDSTMGDGSYTTPTTGSDA